MRSIKGVALIAVISLLVSVAVVGDALAGERGKVVVRDAFFSTNYVSAKVPDVEGHAVNFIEAKGMSFTEKWGACLLVMVAVQDYTKGVGPYLGYIHYTYRDGSTISIKIEGKGKPGEKGEGSWSYIKGTGRFEGIQGGGTGQYWVLGPGQWYTDSEGEYTLP